MNKLLRRFFFSENTGKEAAEKIISGETSGVTWTATEHCPACGNKTLRITYDEGWYETPYSCHCGACGMSASHYQRLIDCPACGKQTLAVSPNISVCANPNCSYVKHH